MTCKWNRNSWQHTLKILWDILLSAAKQQWLAKTTNSSTVEIETKHYQPTINATFLCDFDTSIWDGFFDEKYHNLCCLWAKTCFDLFNSAKLTPTKHNGILFLFRDVKKKGHFDYIIIKQNHNDGKNDNNDSGDDDDDGDGKQW